jgi:hypothetical protein
LSHPEAEGEPDGLLALRLSEILSDPLRGRIVSECSAAAMSPRSFRDEFGGPSLASVLEAFEALERVGWLGRLAEKPEEAPPEAFDRLYRTAKPALFYNSVWSSIPDSTKALVSSRVFEDISARVKNAMKVGTFDKRDDRHHTWTPLALDRQGWDSVIGRVDALFHTLFEEQEEAAARIAESGEEPIPMTVALLAFESPKHSA